MTDGASTITKPLCPEAVPSAHPEGYTCAAADGATQCPRLGDSTTVCPVYHGHCLNPHVEGTS